MVIADKSHHAKEHASRQMMLVLHSVLYLSDQFHHALDLYSMHMVQVFRVGLVLFLVSLLVHFDQVCYFPVKTVKLKRGRSQ